jgi:excisionase family DNA binding protein
MSTDTKFADRLAERITEQLRGEIQQLASPQEPDLLTTEQAAERLNISKRTTETLIHSGELPSVKVRGCRRIPTAALESYIRRLAEEGSTQ